MPPRARRASPDANTFNTAKGLYRGTGIKTFQGFKQSLPFQVQPIGLQFQE